MLKHEHYHSALLERIMMQPVELPSYLNTRRYVSCIKIAGTPILPPLVTDVRKLELNEDRLKAIAIENRLKRKRSSIDSGVMTSSYIETLKNGELAQADNITDQTLSTEITLDDPTMLPSSVIDNDSSETFLMTALQDPQFREYFCSTAERIFDGNRSDGSKQVEIIEPSIFDISCNNYRDYPENLPFTFNLTMADCLPDACARFLEIELSDALNHDGSGDYSADPETELEQVSNGVKITELPTESPSNRVRRNSYTLDCPSPVLLELMAKENTIVNCDQNKLCKNFQPKKDTLNKKGPGFKTFSSMKKPRKTWNKSSFEPTCILLGTEKTGISRLGSNVMRRSKTFIKPDSKKGNPAYSLPSSSRASPIHHLSRFARSVDCVPSFVDNSFTSSSQLLSQPIIENKSPLLENSKNSLKNNLIHSDKVGDLDSSLVQNMTNLSLLNNTSGSVHNTSNTSSVSSELGSNETASQVSIASQSTMAESIVSQADTIRNLIDKNNLSVDANDSVSVCNKNVNKNKTEPFVDFDDSISNCSSLSLSKFLPLDNSDSRPPTADMSTIFVELQLEHERQIKDLLEKQHKEKLLLSQSSTAMSTKSATSLSGFTLSFEQDIPHESFTSISARNRSRNSLNRELFPMYNNSRNAIEPKHLQNISEAQKRAALTITSYARGYLTRRLMRTEKVQQQIDLIKESLTCGLKLQTENHLEKTDFDLLERLENQLTLAFLDLHAMLSAPVSERMHLITQDRERMRRPVSRPSSAISSATQKSILRRQQSANNPLKKNEEMRGRTKSLCLHSNYSPALIRSASFVKSDCSFGSAGENKQRKPWR